MDTLSIVTIVITFIILIACLYYQIKKNGLRATAIQIIVYAEHIIGSGKGEEKMNYAIDSFIRLLPAPFKFLFSREMIRNFIQESFEQIKDALEYNPVGGQGECKR
jgi:hypothetical protein